MKKIVMPKRATECNAKTCLREAAKCGYTTVARGRVAVLCCPGVHCIQKHNVCNYRTTKSAEKRATFGARRWDVLTVLVF